MTTKELLYQMSYYALSTRQPSDILTYMRLTDSEIQLFLAMKLALVCFLNGEPE